MYITKNGMQASRVYALQYSPLACDIFQLYNSFFVDGSPGSHISENNCCFPLHVCSCTVIMNDENIGRISLSYISHLVGVFVFEFFLTIACIAGITYNLAVGTHQPHVHPHILALRQHPFVRTHTHAQNWDC